jgi:hypothetical protein
MSRRLWTSLSWMLVQLASAEELPLARQIPLLTMLQQQQVRVLFSSLFKFPMTFNSVII